MRQGERALSKIYQGGKYWQCIRAIAVGGALGCGVAWGAASPGADSAVPTRAPFVLKAQKASYVGSKFHLSGDVVFISAQFDVRAPIVNGEMGRSGTPAHIQARGGVNFKIELGDKATTAPAHFEGRSDTADLNIAQNILVLKGNLDGSYQVAGGKPDKLRGSQATITFVRPNLNVEVDGGADGVRFEFAPDTPKPSKNNPDPNPQNANAAGNQTPPANSQNTEAKIPAQIGTVVVTAQHATVNALLNNVGDATPAATQHGGATGTVRFIGNARAVSTDGPQQFDIAAPEFVLTRGTTGALDNLKTAGRTQLKIDFPQPAPTGAAPAVAAGGAPAQASKSSALGTPTHVEAQADVMTLQPALSQATLQGNITGFYRLTNETGETQEFDFSGADNVAMKNVSPQEATDDNTVGLHVDAIGKPHQPVILGTPDADINMDKAKSPKRKQ